MRFLLFFTCFIYIVSACGTSKKMAKNETEDIQRYSELFHEGLRSKQRRQYENAIKIFETCISQRKNDDAAFYALSELYGYTNQKEKSIIALEKASAIDPKNEYYIQDLALKYLATEKYQKSGELYKKLIHKNPRNPEWLFSYTECLLKTNKLKEAFESLKQIESAIGESPEICIEKYKVKRYLHEEKVAENILKSAIDKFPEEPELLAQLIDFYFETKNDDAAIKMLFKLSEKDPKNGNVHKILAQYYLEKNDLPNTFKEIKLAFECPEITLETKTNWIVYFFDKQVKLDPAVEELALLLVKEHPSEAKVHTLLGDVQSKNGKDSLALNAYHRAIELDPSRYSIWEEVVIMEYEFHEFDRLFEDCKKAIELFPAKAKLYLLAGVAANQLKKHSDAIQFLEQGKEYAGKNTSLKAEFYAQLGQAYFKNKQVKEATESFDYAIQLEPTNQLNLNNFAFYLAMEKMQLDKAEKMITDVLVLSPNDSHFLDTYGWVLFQKGEYTKALTQFQLATSKSPNEPLILEHLGDCHAKLGNINEAEKYWKLALEKGAKSKVLSKKIDKKQYYDPQL